MTDTTACIFCHKVKRGMHDGAHPMTGDPIKVCRACATKYGFTFDDSTPDYTMQPDEAAMYAGSANHTVAAVLSDTLAMSDDNIEWGPAVWQHMHHDESF